MIRFFKLPQPATLILIPLIILVFWGRMFFSIHPVADQNSLPLWGIAFSFFNVMPSWINFIILFIVISAEAIYLTILLNKHEVLYKNSFLPALIFALFISALPEFMQLHPIHIVNLLVLRIFDRALTLYKNELNQKALFDASFLSGVTALIYFPCIVMLPFLMIIYAILLPFRLKEWLIMIIGFVLPAFFLSTYLFWNYSLGTFWSMYMELFKNIHPEIIFKSGTSLLALSSCIGLLLLFSLIKLRANYRKNVIRTRIYQQVFFIFLLMSGIFIILSEKISIIHFSFLIIPLSVFCAYFFLSTRRRIWIYETTLWGIIAMIIWNNFIN